MPRYIDFSPAGRSLNPVQPWFDWKLPMLTIVADLLRYDSGSLLC